MRAIRAFLLWRADSLHQLLSIMGEFVDCVHVVIDHPHMLFRIVRIDGDKMRALQDFVPLRPALDDVAFGIYDDDAVFPIRIDTELAVIQAHAVSWVLTGAPSCGRR